METSKRRPTSCPLEAALDLVGGKWKPVMLHHLDESGTIRFSELRRKIPAITQRMLTRQLRDLEADGLVSRNAFRVVPPRVEYALTEKGKSIGPLLLALANWGVANAPHFDPMESG